MPRDCAICMPMFALSRSSADAVQNTFEVPESVIRALPLELDLIVSRVSPVVPLNVPLPTSQAVPLTIRYCTTLESDPNPDANV